MSHILKVNVHYVIGGSWCRIFGFSKYDKMLLSFMKVHPITPSLPQSFASLFGVGMISSKLGVDISSCLDASCKNILPT